MKTFLQFLLTWIILMIVVFVAYLFIGFIVNNYNILTWHWTARLCICVFAILLSSGALAEFRK